MTTRPLPKIPRPTVLIVDDDEEMREYEAPRILRGLIPGVAVIGVANVAAALVMMTEHRPDWILTDVYLSSSFGSGLDVATLAHSKNIPVVAMSMHCVTAPPGVPLASKEHLKDDLAAIIAGRSPSKHDLTATGRFVAGAKA